MIHIVTNAAQNTAIEPNPCIAVSDLLEVIDDSVDFTYHIGSTSYSYNGSPSASKAATTLTLQYYDAESKGELYAIMFPDMPAWLINQIELGNSVKLVDAVKQVTIELASQVRELN
ncbi:MAG: hypothetical protein KC426_03715 [Oceanospirillaceae bacterium]|nr:hypothetical protein [Oceanospirillaceae bacterium]